MRVVENERPGCRVLFPESGAVEYGYLDVFALVPDPPQPLGLGWFSVLSQLKLRSGKAPERVQAHGDDLGDLGAVGVSKARLMQIVKGGTRRIDSARVQCLARDGNAELIGLAPVAHVQ